MGFIVTSSGERSWKGNEPGVVCFVPGFAHINHQKAGVYCLAFELRLLPLDKEVEDNTDANMEGALIARDRVGVQDFVLLDSHTSETSFLNNLRKRYQENLIYTYIGTLLVSVNPYKELDIYTVTQMQLYRGVNFFELPPHLYAIADNAYRVMCSEYNNHFILISGESGAGKTEASKKILQYYAVTCPTTEQLQIVRDRLLLSNPVLEAFGNAKTLRNDNSSRFGKYMDIQFDFKGAPVGGHILSYLIEKSRVVHQNHGERNFHIFYQLLEGGDKDLLCWLGLERNPQKYAYLIQGRCAKVFSINDKNDWKIVRKAFSIIDFTEKDLEHLFGIVASVLHLGNIQFEEDSNGHAIIRNGTQIKWISKVSLTSQVLSPLNVDLAFYARDAVAKAIYGRTFTWLVNKINGSLANKDSTRKTVIGLLDIYGFEVLDTNSFEQFCINYCNEKLQQLLIEMTLKAEQEEYELEGIEWEPIPYFNNKIICDLVEQKHKGIISILDEECLRPGEATDLSFLEKLEEKVGDHAHFVTRKLADQKTRKSIDWVDFRLLHYAGEVTYCAVGFLEKNNDLLYRNLKEVRVKKGMLFLYVATQFKNSLMSLIEILMSKEPSYVRCIKPNENKEPGKFDDFLIRHQVKYLGLMEHLRVRRAGFAYRRKYELFLQRYKSLCPATWPHWHGPAAEGVERLIKHIGYKPEEYKLGRHGSACWRGALARKEAKKRTWAVQIIRKFINGFINRKKPLCPENIEFVRLVQYNYFMKLRDHVPKTVLDKSWLRPPSILEETSEMLKKICIRNLVRKYCRGVTDERKVQLQQKVVASAVFRGKKEGYLQSINQPFADTRLSEYTPSLLKDSALWSLYATPVVKYDRNGFKARERLLVLTQSSAYVVEMAKIKQKIDYATLKGKGGNRCGAFLPVSDPGAEIKGEGTMVFTVGQESQIFKAKNGQLTVVRPQLSSGNVAHTFSSDAQPL
uniref:Myosin IH n=1 Tax=Anser brachyrhynchus TaxID=132585 RepID=A0A8B9ICM3_9AVES